MRFPKIISFTWISLGLALSACDKDHDQAAGPRPDSNHRAAKREKRGVPAGGVAADPVDKTSIRDLLLAGTSRLEGPQKMDALSFMRSAPLKDCKAVLAQMPIGPDYEFLLAEFSERFGKEDLDGALDWLLAMPAEAHLENAYSRIGRLAAADPGKLRERLASITDEGLRSEMASGFLLGLVQTKKYGEIDRLLSSRKEAAKLGLDINSVFHTTISEMTRQGDSASAFAQIQRWSSQDMFPTNGSSQLALKNLGAKDPAAAHAFLAGHASDDVLIRQAAADIVSGCAQNDPIGTSKWLGTVRGLLFDQGAYGMIQSIARTEPTSAATWALSISDAGLRDQAFRNISMASRFERDKIRQAILESALSSENKGRLLPLFE